MPTREVLLSALKDAEREGHPMDIVELACEFGISVEQAEVILEGQ